MALAAVKKDSPKQKDAEAAPAPKAKKSKLKWIILGLTLFLLPAIGGGVYWFMHKDKGEGAEAKVEPPKPPVFVPLETFTVNLQVEEVPQFLQVGLSLRVADDKVLDSVKLHMPEIRNSILLLLSNQKASALVTLPGKNKLSADIVAVVNTILVPPAPAAKSGAKPAAASAEAQTAADAPAETPEAAAPGEAKGAEDAAEEAPAAKAPKKKAADKAAPAAPIVSVLFTSFIVQ